MDYKIINRPKLPRNKYGQVDDKTSVGGGTSYFTTSSNPDGNGGDGTDNISVFVGSTNSENGKEGLVPKPKTNNDEPLIDNDNIKFLKGNGAWTDIPISRYTNENANKDGINFYGNLNINNTLTTQTLNVTGAAHFWELIIDKVKAAGGNLIITPGNFEVTYIAEPSSVYYSYDPETSPSYDPWNLFFYDENEQTGIDGLKEIFNACHINNIHVYGLYQKRYDDGKKISNEIQPGDMIRCKTFNSENSSNLANNKDYWSFVLQSFELEQNSPGNWSGYAANYITVFAYFTVEGSSTQYGIGTTCYSDGYIAGPGETHTVANPPAHGISSFTFGYGNINAEVGDNLVVLGHLWDGERQGGILISSYDPMDTELQAPSISQYEGINKFTTLSPFRTTAMAANGNMFLGKFMVNNNGVYMDIDQKLNMFVADLNTGLEKVGIHLDGDNSTIKMIGSVEVKQNSDGVVDTFTVWDSANIMRVKISPEAIPNKSNIQTNINPTSNINFRTISGLSTPTSGSVYHQHSYKYFAWVQWNHQWKYWLENAYFSYTSSVGIGTFNAGDKITVSGLKTNILSKAYFKGQDYVSTRSDSSHSQSISSVILRLQKQNGSSWTNVETYNITSTAGITVANESANITYANNIMDNYTLSSAGTYRLELAIVYNVYATITYGSEQSNAYFSFDNSVTSSVQLTQPSASMTRIGRNGIAFNTDSTGQYFYAGNDGIEMKWGDTSITLDSTNGLKLNSGLTNITSSSSKYIPNSATVVICTTLSSDTTVYLPPVANYGIGREITVIGNDYVTVSTYSSSEYIYKFKGENSSGDSYPSKLTDTFSTSRTVSMTSTRYTTKENEGTIEYTYYRSHTPMYRFISTGSGWYLL